MLDLIDDLPAALRLVRAARQKTLREVAGECGVHFSTLHNVERGRLPTVPNVRRITKWLAGE